MQVTRLTAKSLISYAIWAIWAGRGILAKLSIVPAALLVTGAVLSLGALSGETPPAPEGATPEPPSGTALIGMLLYLLGAIAAIPTLTGWHRLVILSSPERGAGRLYGWDRREWRYLLNSVLLGLAVIGVLLVFSLAVGPLLANLFAAGEAAFSPGRLLVVIAVSVAQGAIVALITAQFGLVLPAAAIGKPIGMAAAAAMASGHVRSMAVALFVVSFVGGLIQMPLSWLEPLFADAPLGLAILLAANALLYIVVMAMSVGVLSCAYSLIDEGSAGRT